MPTAAALMPQRNLPRILIFSSGVITLQLSFASLLLFYIYVLIP
jgi:hypothetical protein